MSGKLHQQVVVITGGASGIGAGCARLFANEGARVVIADVDRKTGAALAADLPDARFMPVEVTDPDSVRQLMQQVHRECGRLDVLVNNAGIDGEQGLTADSAVDNWDRVRSVNLDGVFYCMKFGLELMRGQAGGVILNMASVCGLKGVRKLPAYAASKAGVVHLTRSAALEYAADRIRINALCPSVVRTPLLEHFVATSDNPDVTLERLEGFNPLPGMVTVEAVAKAALFLCSNDAQFITGVALPVDGGYTVN